MGTAVDEWAFHLAQHWVSSVGWGEVGWHCFPALWHRTGNAIASLLLPSPQAHTALPLSKRLLHPTPPHTPAPGVLAAGAAAGFLLTRSSGKKTKGVGLVDSTGG